MKDQLRLLPGAGADVAQVLEVDREQEAVGGPGVDQLVDAATEPGGYRAAIVLVFAEHRPALQGMLDRGQIDDSRAANCPILGDLRGGGKTHLAPVSELA